MESKGENYLGIINEIQSAVSIESQRALRAVDEYLETVGIASSLKIKIMSTLKGNLNNSMPAACSILERKIQSKVFKNYSNDRQDEERKDVDESLVLQVKGLQEAVDSERAKKRKLLKDIMAGKKHIEALNGYINTLNNYDSSASEENLLDYLKLN